MTLVLQRGLDLVVLRTIQRWGVRHLSIGEGWFPREFRAKMASFWCPKQARKQLVTSLQSVLKLLSLKLIPIRLP